MSRKQTELIWVWLEPDPEETEQRVWIITNMGACAQHDVEWLDTEPDLESELQDAIADAEPPEDAAGVLVSGYLWSERCESIDYGVDYDGGFEVLEMLWLYAPAADKEPFDHE